MPTMPAVMRGSERRVCHTACPPREMPRAKWEVMVGVGLSEDEEEEEKEEVFEVKM